jgi:putative transcriptional regulator
MNMAKRDLFNELMEGFDALKAERGGKITLRTTEIEMPKPIKMGANQIIKIRKAHNYSQAVFARMLATKVSTLRNWEQGRSEPNAQAKVLLKMVDTDPDVLLALARVTTGTAAVKAKPKAKVRGKAAAKKAVAGGTAKNKVAARRPAVA